MEKYTDQLILENELVRYMFNKDGCLVEAYDKELKTNILLEGKNGNLLLLGSNIY
jgi:hypothetical protein